MSTNRVKRIVILGGGFGGMYAALELEKSLARDPDVEVTLVNRENFFLFTPMLHEVAASDLDFTHIVNPVRKLLRRVKFFSGGVERIDLEERLVTVSHGDEHHHHELRYDHLVLALGSVTNFFGLPGLEERAMTMKSLGDAIGLRNHMVKNLEEADFECCPKTRETLLTFVVAGGGFAGVETVAAMNDFLREAVEFYPHLDESMLRVVLVHPGSVVLPELSESLGRYAGEKMRARGVEIKAGTRVKSVSDTGVELSDGSMIPTNTLVWAAGTAPNPKLADLPCAKVRGRVRVNEFLEVEDHPGVWALGDCADVPDLTTGKSCPPTAQHALRQGKVIAENITAALRGGRKRKFVFATIGQLASIGKRTGVAQIFGHNFSGFVAWLMWRTIYLSKLPRFEKKFRVALDWTLDVLFAKDLVQFTAPREQFLAHLPKMGEEMRSGLGGKRDHAASMAAAA
ncbi:MAG TPA: NAD(P)/FAD-dependent oxidoreductase [Pyrinomonadaceae bacterium]|nr:NAD(P)/FAD-dependent oxidoreductase [Pyrinomonadaceae bacterium]